MLNSISIQGRLVEEPELKQTMNGVSTTSFSIATDRNYGKDKTTDFFNVVAWRNTAEFINKYFHKGQEILITGTLQNDTWEDNKGNKRTATKIVVDNVSFCGSKNDNKGSTDLTVYPGADATVPTPDYSNSIAPQEDENDLPF